MYSIEEICDAMITTASAAVSCRTERDILFCALQAVGDLLDVSCCVFYPAPSSTGSNLGTVRVNHRGSAELVIPEKLPSTFTDYLRRDSGRIIVSREWDALGTILPSFDFSSCSSLWICVGNEERTFGTIAVFDHSSRRFERTQQKIVELTASIITAGLKLQTTRHSMTQETNTHQEFSSVVATIARDLINPLSAIFGYVELLKAESLEQRPAHLVARVEEQIEKARRVIANFSRETALTKARSGEIIVPTERAELERATVSIVKRASAASGQEWQAATPELNPGARILLVQRSEAVLEFQRSVLSALGAEVIPAFSASDALDQLRARELDAIILDDELEESFSSKRLVLWVRENRPELADRILLTVSRKPSQETREILEIAMLPHVTKPLEVLELYSRAQQVLQAGRNPHLLQ